MSKFIGRLVNLGVAPESTRGVGVAPTYWLARTEFSFDDKVVKARSEAGVGSISDSEQALITTKYGEGDIGGEIRDKSFGVFLYALLGSLSTAGPSDSAYTHSFSLSESNQHKSLSLHVQDPNTNELYELCMLSSLEISAELDDFVRFTATFMGKKGQTYTPARTVTYVTENKFSKNHLTVKLATSIGGLAAASGLSLKRMTITFDKNVELDDVLGTAEPEDILNKQMSIEGELELNYEDETYKNYMKDGSYRSMEIKLNNTDVLIGSSSRPSLTMQFPKVDFFDWEADYGLNDISKQTVSFKANRDVPNALKAISTCDLVNGVASY